jgi:hypothetical protein
VFMIHDRALMEQNTEVARVPRPISPKPWRFLVMSSAIIIKDSTGVTVCQLPYSPSSKARKFADATAIVEAINAG